MMASRKTMLPTAPRMPVTTASVIGQARSVSRRRTSRHRSGCATRSTCSKSAPGRRAADAGPTAVVLVAATLALLAIPLLRWLAPHGQRHGGGPTRLFLGLAVVLSSSAIAIGTMGVASPGSVLGLVSVLALMIGLPSDDGGTLGCGARSEVVLYRIDDRTLDELLAADPELAAGLATIAAARLVQRLIGRR